MIDTSLHQPLSPRTRRPSTEASDRTASVCRPVPTSSLLRRRDGAVRGASGVPRSSRCTFALSSPPRTSASSVSSVSSTSSSAASAAPPAGSRRAFRRDLDNAGPGVSSLRAYTPQTHISQDLRALPSPSRGISPGTPSLGQAASRSSHLAAPASCPGFSSSVLSSSYEDSVSSLSSSPNSSSLTSPTPLEDNGPEEEGLDGEDTFRVYAGEDCPSAPLTPSLAAEGCLPPTAFLRSSSSSSLTRGETEGAPRIPYLNLGGSAQPTLDSTPSSRGSRRLHRSVSPASPLASEHNLTALSRYALPAATPPFAGLRRIPGHPAYRGAQGVFACSAGADVEASEAVSSSGDESVVRGRGQVSFCSTRETYEDIRAGRLSRSDLAGHRPRHGAAFLVDPVVSASVCSRPYTRRLRGSGRGVASRRSRGIACAEPARPYVQGAGEERPPLSLSPGSLAEVSLRGEGPACSHVHLSAPVDLPSPSSLLLHLDEAAAGAAIEEDHRGGWRKFLASLAAMRARKWSTSDGVEMMPSGVSANAPGDDEEDPPSASHSSSLKSRIFEATAATRSAFGACMRPGRLSGRCYFCLHLASLLLILCVVLLAGTLQHDQKIYRLRPKQVAELQLHTTQRLRDACDRAARAIAPPRDLDAALQVASRSPSDVSLSDLSLESRKRGAQNALTSTRSWHRDISSASIERICRHVRRLFFSPGHAGEAREDDDATAHTQFVEDSGKDVSGSSAESITATSVLRFLRPCAGHGTQPPPCMPAPTGSSPPPAGTRTCRAPSCGFTDLSQLCLPLAPLADVHVKAGDAAGLAAKEEPGVQTRCAALRAETLQTGLSETCSVAASFGVCGKSFSSASSATLSDERPDSSLPNTFGSSGVSPSSAGSGLAAPSLAFPHSVSLFFFHREGLPSSFLDPSRPILACTEADSPFLHLFSFLGTSSAYRMLSAAFVSLLSSAYNLFSLTAGAERTDDAAAPGRDSRRREESGRRKTTELVATKINEESSLDPVTCNSPLRFCTENVGDASRDPRLSGFELGLVSLLEVSPCQGDCSDLWNAPGFLGEGGVAAQAHRHRAEKYASAMRAAFGNLLPQFFLLSYESALASREETEAAATSRLLTSSSENSTGRAGAEASDTSAPSQDPDLAEAPVTSFLPNSGLMFDFAVFATPCYPFSRFLHRRLVSWGGLQFHILLFAGWLHSLFAPEPLILLHVPRALFLVLVSAYRGAVLYEGLNWIEKMIWTRKASNERSERGTAGEKHTKAEAEKREDPALLNTAPSTLGAETSGPHTEANDAEGKRTGDSPSTDRDGSGGNEKNDGGWWARKDLSDHVVLYVMAIVFMSIEVAAARSSHAPPSFSPEVTSADGDASQKRVFSKWLSCLLPRRISSFVYGAVFIYYGFLFVCCLHMAYYTAVFFHTPEEIWVGLTVGVCFLVLPILVLLEVLEWPSLQRIGIGSGEKKAAERAAAAAAAATVSGTGAQGPDGDTVRVSSPRMGRAKSVARTTQTPEEAAADTAVAASLESRDETLSREASRNSQAATSLDGDMLPEKPDKEEGSRAEETPRTGIGEAGAARWDEASQLGVLTVGGNPSQRHADCTIAYLDPTVPGFPRPLFLPFLRSALHERLMMDCLASCPPIQTLFCLGQKSF
uniref:Inositol phospholipid synthesis protein Scs3p n=1 Tax=Toxoplasma gondii COUG TaxID=1074873 RepID=A0A2G8XZS1_TOXGO|nr:inositol phospholipid synthesis protein Scs3p [Toxoplasma gondii COUG]